MFGLLVLRAIGFTCMMIVVENHIHMEWWEGMLVGFGGMMALGTLFDKGKL